MENIIFNVHDTVLLLTAYQSLLFAVFLMTIKRKKHQGNVYLALFLLQQTMISCAVLVTYGAQFRQVVEGWSPFLFYFIDFGYWLEGPFLLLYTRSLVYSKFELRKRDIFHFIPFLFYVLYQIVFVSFADQHQLTHSQYSHNLFVDINNVFIVTVVREVLRVVWGVLCLVELKRYADHIKSNFSSIAEIDLSWLKFLVVGFLVVRAWLAQGVLQVIVFFLFGSSFSFELMGLFGNYFTFLFVSALIFLSLGHSSSFEGLKQEPEAIGGSIDNDSISPEQIENLLALMESEKPHLIPSLTLDQLAKIANMQSRQLSTLINRKFECNFFEFVNAYRIDEAKRILANPEFEKKKVLDVMLDVGFNSKATFNTLFKKKVGMTPVEFRKVELGREI